MRLIFILLFTLSALSQADEKNKSASDQSFSEKKLWVADSDNNPLNDAALLGQDLFFDTRLSGNNKMACASCHSPSLGWSDGLKKAVGHQGKRLTRSTPTLLNIRDLNLLMWDGRATSLENQILLPLTSVKEMNMDAALLVPKLSKIPSYATRFASIYNDGLTLTNILHAIAQFEMTLTSHESPFDQWIQGKNSALKPAAKKGFEIFTDPNKGNCATCHLPPNFTDEGYHNIGLENIQSPDADLGRYNIIPIAVLKGAFKTPGLKDIAVTAPYFHDGSAATLMDVIEYYSSGGHFSDGLSPNMKKLNLSISEKEALLAFLHSLTSFSNREPN